MDIENVRKVAGSLDSESSHITSVLSSLSSALAATPWKGPDRDKFVEEWNNVHVPAIRKAASDMHLVSTQVTASINAQITASGS